MSSIASSSLDRDAQPLAAPRREMQARMLRVLPYFADTCDRKRVVADLMTTHPSHCA